jgi:hypothetical protein
MAEENDPKGIASLVAPITSKDPKRADEDKPKSREEDNVLKAKAELKAETDELVSYSSSSQFGRRRRARAD